MTSSTPAATAPAPAGSRRGTVTALAIAAILTLVLDQATKFIALERLVPGERVPFLGDLLGWRLVFNPGAAFSFGTGATWFFTLVMALVSAAVIIAAPRVRSRLWAVALGLLLGGALGNLVDRLAREPGFAKGHVVDFIDYGVFIGNVADIAIVGAAIGIVALSLFGITWDGAPRNGAAGAASDPATEADSDPDSEESAVDPQVTPRD